MSVIKWNDALITTREKKDRELNMECSKRILEGFIHNIDGVDYWFSYDIEAQLNMQGVKKMLDEGSITSKRWTVRIGGKDGEYSRVDVTKPVMDAISLTALQHVDDKVSWYRDVLMPIINNSTSVTEIDAVHWDMEVSTT